MLTVGHGAVWVCDERLPVVVRVDRITGHVLGVASWPIDDALREQPSIADIDARGATVWVASPSAGGLVRLASDLQEEPHLVAIDAPVEVSQPTARHAGPARRAMAGSPTALSDQESGG